MAAPPSKTSQDLNGNWVMNRKLSGDTDAILTLQGIAWMTRKIINMATVTLHTKQYKDEQGLTHIDIDQTATGGVKGTTELRILDWEERGHKDTVFGEVKGRSRMIKLSDLTVDPADAEDLQWLKHGWDEAEDSEHVQSLATSVDAAWVANQIWGFQEVDGQRYYCRNVVVRKGDKVIRDRIVYDYQAA